LSNQGDFCIHKNDCDKDNLFEPEDLRQDPSIETPCDRDENLVWDDCGAHCIDTCSNYDITNNKLEAHPCSKICSAGCRCKDGMVVFEGECRNPSEVCGNFNTCEAKGAKYATCLGPDRQAPSSGNGNSCETFLSPKLAEEQTECIAGCYCPPGTTWLLLDLEAPDNKCVPISNCGYCNQLLNTNCQTSATDFNSYEISNFYPDTSGSGGSFYNTILPRFFNFDLSLAKKYYEDFNGDPLDLGIIGEENSEQLQGILATFANTLIETNCVKSLNEIYEFKTVEQLLAVSEEDFMENFVSIEACGDIIGTYEDELVNHTNQVEPYLFEELIAEERRASQIPGDCECPSRRSALKNKTPSSKSTKSTADSPSSEDSESASSKLEISHVLVGMIAWLAV